MKGLLEWALIDLVMIFLYWVWIALIPIGQNNHHKGKAGA